MYLSFKKILTIFTLYKTFLSTDYTDYKNSAR